MTGRFIMVDGIEGCGKSTIVRSWKEFLAKQGNAIFDLKEYYQSNHRYPEFAEVKPYDFIINAEPSFAGVGQVIRDELIKQGNNYPPRAIAEAFSLDRLISYQRLLIPAIADGKCIIQDRGVSTSLCYQALAADTPINFLTALPGNEQALRYRPDHLVLVNVPVDAALQRLAKRFDKVDAAIFDKASFQQQAADRFASADYRRIFEERGTKIIDFSAEEDIAAALMRANQLLQTLINS